jgi:hypothetical protein
MFGQIGGRQTLIVRYGVHVEQLRVDGLTVGI